MSGIHLHPHDILDEPMAEIRARLEMLQDVQYVLPEVNTIFERNPVPVGELPHNPVHRVVFGDGSLHAVLPSYAELGLEQRRSPTVSADHDPLMIIKDAMTGTGIDVVGWLNVLNGDFRGSLLEENAVVDYAGRIIDHWLCPNGPNVLALWQRILTDLSHRYGFTTYMIDRIRYPDWAGATIDANQLLTCFCHRCQEQMQVDGLDVQRVRSAIGQWRDLIKNGRFDQSVAYFGGSDILRAWQAFRQRSVTNFVSQLIQSGREVNPDITFWLDLWPPAYGWFLGQDYSSLTRLAPAFKHFPYHRLGGGADVQGLIKHIAAPGKEQEAFTAFLRFFELPYDLTYEEFKTDGFPIRFVADQNDIARSQAGPDTRIFCGVQMWNLTPQDLVEAVRAAERSSADDILYYCYGWAGDDLFEAIRDLRRFPERPLVHTDHDHLVT